MHYACVTNISDGSVCSTASINVFSDGVVSFPSTLGVGLNKTIVVTVVDVGYIGSFSQASPPIYFDYAAPDIIGLRNYLILMSDGVTPTLMPLELAELQV